MAEATADPWEIGRSHERSASKESQRKRGAFYTPRSVVEGLLRLAVPDSSDAVCPDAVCPDPVCPDPGCSDPGCSDLENLPSTILDPTCGGGAFLVGALDRLVELGLSAEEALGRVWGIDIDPGAVVATREALRAWGSAHGITGPKATRSIAGRVAHGDALDLSTPSLPDFPTPDLIVGNPPFATPLKGTVFPDAAVAFRVARPDLFGPYVDLAGIHLQAAVERCQDKPGATVAFVLPQSILASRGSEGLRRHLDQVAPARALWSTAEAVFEANVRVCALVLTLGSSSKPEPVVIANGPNVRPIGQSKPGESWASQAARALGAPDVELEGEPLGVMVQATAGFRDEYYALAEACRELADTQPNSAEIPPPIKITTVGSLDPLISGWGRQPTRFAKKSWQQPIVDRARVARDPRMSRWLDRQLRPKVLLPTQSKVFEPVIDREGTMAPVTPVLCIHADPKDLNRIAAIFLAPPIVAWAYQRWFGTALAVQAIKIAARDIATFPKPLDLDLWDEAAQMVGQADDLEPAEICQQVIEIAKVMNQAYNGTQDTFDWWLARLP